MTVYWLVWDAAAHWVVARLEAEGALPSVSGLRAHGTHAAMRPPTPNCQTPPSLATLFTGTWPDVHGVTGYRVPTETGPIEASRSGFARSSCRAAPVWERAGVRTVGVHVPWMMPGGGSLPSWLDCAVDAYGRRVAGHGAYELGGSGLEFRIGGESLRAAAEGALVRVGGVLVGDKWTEVGFGAGHVMWARQATVAGRRMLLHTGAWTSRVAGWDGAVAEALAAVPAFAGEGLGSIYRVGGFGPRLVDGGDGSAEDLLTDSLSCVHQSFETAADTVLERHDADLVVIYLPTTDEIGHELLGWCDPRSSAYRPDFEERVWAQIREVYGWADELLGKIIDRSGPDDTVLLTADHGMAGAAWTVHPNTVLAEAGFVALTSDGRIDPRRSRVLYHPAGNGSLQVNDEGRDGGWIPADQIPGLLAEAGAALRAAACGLVYGLRQGKRSAHVLFAPDCLPSAELAPGGHAVHPARKPGAHVTNQGDDRFHAVFAAAGPGLGSSDLGVQDNTLPALVVLNQLRTTPRHH